MEVGLPLPLVQPCGDQRVHQVEIAGQSLATEGWLHQPPVLSVIGAVAQHQAAREELFQHRRPATLTGKGLIAVEQHLFVDVGAEAHHARQKQKLPRATGP